MVHIGIAGWDYPDWDGIVYPTARRRGFDRLAWIARFVQVVEINSSFYRPVAPHTAERWVLRTEGSPGLRFTAKAHRALTHEPDADLATALDDTLEGLTPLRAAGRLGALLLQFPQSFHHEPESLARLAGLAERLAGWPVVVEVRHVSWDGDDVAGWFRERGLGWCAIDQPRVGRSTVGLRARVTSPVAYLRLHGRNRRDWFRRDAGRDARYDYLYPSDQVDALVEPVRRMAGEARQLFVVQNNHFRGQALANALQLRYRVEGVRPPAPPALVDLYPEIAPDVEVQRDGLF
jgi:uncharacterized protein YecE (DUF72 family)